MAKIEKYEAGILLVLFVYFQFAATNINPTLGTIYALFSLGSAVFIIIDQKRSIPFRKENDSLLGSIAIGAFAYVALIAVGNFIIIPGLNQIVKLLSSTTPVLASSPFFNTLSFGVGVPFAETYMFFIVSYDILATWINVDISWNNILNPKLIGLIGLISFAFMFFHLTAKGVSNIPTLGLVFAMAVISMLLVTYFKDGEKAIYFHVISNISALLL